MKKRWFLLMVAVVCACLSVQALTPMQLKTARLKTYDWVKKYNANTNASRRNDLMSLFQSEDILVVNDYLPTCYKNPPAIALHSYLDEVCNTTSFYKMTSEVNQVEIIQERLVNDSTLFLTVQFDKTIQFGQRDNWQDTRYTYPSVRYTATAQLCYNLLMETVIAQSIQSDRQFDNIAVLHDTTAANVNQYITEAELKDICQQRTTDSPLVSYSYWATDFDPQMFYYQQDTLKNNIHFGPSVGVSLYNANYLTTETAFLPLAGLSYGFDIGYYRQLKLKQQHRLGIEIDLTFSQQSYGMEGSYAAQYQALDADGGSYLRKIDVSHYTERFHRYALTLPIAIRYDYFFTSQLSMLVKAGFSFAYDVQQQTNANLSATYSGYYDWLLDVTITQNGIYDFGAYTFTSEAQKTALQRFSIGAFAAIGVQYLFPNSNWAFQAALQYGATVYNHLSNPIDFHLTERTNDWQSATYLWHSFIGHNVSLSLQFNYHF